MPDDLRIEMSSDPNPRASRPYMPGYGILDSQAGRGLLPWSWAVDRLARARNYWIATTRPDGKPHLMPVWGVWLDNRLYFSTGPQSRKARNLAENPRCSVSIESGDDAVILEGEAQRIGDPDLIRDFADAYGEKYQWDMSDFTEPIYGFIPSVGFGFNSSPGEFTSCATRWTF